MKLKKCDVYKEAKGSRFFRVVDKPYFVYSWQTRLIDNIGYEDSFDTDELISDIHTGKLIKIPQLYK